MTNPPSPPLQLKRIIYVEDDEDIQVIVKMSLEDIGGMIVKCFNSGKELLAYTEDFQPQLLLLDVMMPEMDGLTLFKELRKNPKYVNTPVIFITAKSQAQEIDYYKKQGALDVFIKPFEPATLAQELQEKWQKYTKAK